MEPVGQPRSAVDIEVPADGVGAVFFQGIEGIHGVALALTHLLAVLILYMAQNDHVLKAGLIEQQGRLGV